MRKIGIFSGSFNPIHIGHLILANYISEFSDLDEVWFLVTPQSPFKKESIVSDEIRLKMVEESLVDFPKLKTSDFEFLLPKPSYTINTLDELKKQYPSYDFSLIIGADNWELFYKWRDYDKILNNYNIIVYPRIGSEINIPEKYIKKVKKVDAPIIEISSTFIRNSIKDNKNIKSFLPAGVFKIIEQKELYKLGK